MTQPPAGRAVRDGDAPRDGKITREVVLAAALEIIDRDGADGLSMRFARALDRDPMILYRHAPKKAALLDGVAETVLAQLEVDPANPDWAGQLRAVARDFRALALAHPHVVPRCYLAPGHTGSRCGPRAPCARSKMSSPCSPGPASAAPTRCTSTGPCSASCTAMCSTNCKNSSTTRTRPTTCCGWACTGCRSANSPCSAASPRFWPPTTAPPNSNAASISSLPGWPPRCLPETGHGLPAGRCGPPAGPPPRPGHQGRAQGRGQPGARRGLIC